MYLRSGHLSGSIYSAGQSTNSPGAVTEEGWILGIPEESQALPDLKACFIQRHRLRPLLFRIKLFASYGLLEERDKRRSMSGMNVGEGGLSGWTVLANA